MATASKIGDLKREAMTALETRTVSGTFHSYWQGQVKRLLQELGARDEARGFSMRALVMVTGAGAEKAVRDQLEYLDLCTDRIEQLELEKADNVAHTQVPDERFRAPTRSLDPAKMSVRELIANLTIPQCAAVILAVAGLGGVAFKAGSYMHARDLEERLWGANRAMESLRNEQLVARAEAAELRQTGAELATSLAACNAERGISAPEQQVDRPARWGP